MDTNAHAKLEEFMKDKSKQNETHLDSGFGSLNITLESEVEEKQNNASEGQFSDFDAIIQQYKGMSIGARKESKTESSNQIYPDHIYDPVDEDGDTFLMLLLVHGEHEILKSLIENCGNVDKLNIQNCTGQTLLFCAVCMENREISCLLIRKNARLDLVDHEGQNIFHVCADNSYVSLLQDILQVGQDIGKVEEMLHLINRGNSQGYTPFYMAVSKQDRDMCSCLASIKKLNVNKPDNRSFNTPLHEAVCRNTVDPTFIDFLIRTCKVNLNLHNYQGFTPLHIVAARDDVSVFKVFMNYNVDFEAVDIYGKTPLDRADSNIRSYLSEIWKK